jgi:DNA-binding GntR family transcriptional regulator
MLHATSKVLEVRFVEMDKLEPLTLPNNSSLSQLDTRSLSSKIYERLLTAIVRDEIGAAQSLDVEKLAEAFGVSRTPIQVAVARLADLGLVEIRPRRGTFVARLTEQDVHELFEIRCVIEVHAVKKVATLASKDELMELKRLVQGLRKLFSGDQYKDYYEFLDQDRQFHSMIVTLGRNQRLLLMYNQARTLIELTRASASKQITGANLTHERHLEIVDALVDRDGMKAALAVEKHIQESEQSILARLHFPKK